MKNRNTCSVRTYRAENFRWACGVIAAFLLALVPSLNAQTSTDDNNPLNLQNQQQYQGPTTVLPLPNPSTPSMNGMTSPSGTSTTQGGMNQGTLYGTGQQTGNQQFMYGNQTYPGQQYFRMLAPEPLTEFQKMVASMTGRTLPIFGASIFRSDIPSTFAPVLTVPVSSDYVIGPDDELRLQIWGQVNLQGSFRVDRTGDISIPQMGTVHVAGQRYDQLADYLRAQLSRVFRNFNLNVTMGQLRTIQVFVVGQARHPGSYTISSLSTMINALFASGGPTPQGSLRDIQLRRGSQTVVDFDLYDLLLHGDKSKDVTLAPGDVIFIPAVGPQVGLVGSVNAPAIYELKKGPTSTTAASATPETSTPATTPASTTPGGTTVADLLELGGGRTNIAAGSQVRVERIMNRSILSVADVDIAEPATTQLQDGDIVSVISMVDRIKNAVTLRGNVANPGRYVWHPGMHINDLIPDKDSLLTRDYWFKRNQIGQMPESYPSQLLQQNENQNFQNQMQGQYPYQYPYQNQYQNQNQNQYQGQGQNQYQGSQNNSIQAQSQNYGQSQNQTDTGMQGASQQIPGNTDNSVMTNQAVRRGLSQSGQGGGSVASALTTEEGAFGVKNYIELSAPDVDWTYAVIERQSAVDLSTKLIPFNLGKAVLDKDASQNLELQPGDVVTIFSTSDLRVPNSQQTRFVRLEGEFAGAGIYSVQPGETLRQLVKRAGGFTPDAFLYASAFTRRSTKRVQQQRLQEYADQLEAQVLAQTTTLAQNAISTQDTAAATAAAVSARATIARLRQLEPEGRIVLQLSPDSQGVDSLPDLALEDGDRFVVPKAPSDVNVQGQVYSANAFVYEPGRRMKDYLKLAGGPGRQADTRRAFVMRADGSVVSEQYANLGKAPMYPGDTIVVPLRVERKAILRNLVDIATVFGQFGLGIAAINQLK